MNLRSIDLNLLTVFHAVITEGNISRAAEKIGMSQPATSAALSRLRLILKDELFIRTGRGVRPTPRAQELEKPVRQILEMIRNTLTQPEEFDYTASNRSFTIASMDYGGVLIAPRLMYYLQQLGSPVTINIHSSNDARLIDKMRFGTVDFNIDYMQMVEEDFHNAHVITETASCLVRKAHPIIRDELTLDQYLDAQQVVVYPYGQRVSVMEEFLTAMDVRRHRTMVVPSFLNYPYIVSSTDLICTLPSRVGRIYAAQYDLNLFPLPVPGFKVDYYLMWYAGLEYDPAHRWMQEILLNLCRQE
ncbi:LysR family transcriptional regulator [Parahaliea mediterranea]|uniref:LysR family transcriptional regulator n=1 Tax=Parahaliea mediterranea TaxID=651086 RepID=UPI0014749A73|nr:LysR family transcriptional regulator [Parahaliea mediterranea]